MNTKLVSASGAVCSWSCGTDFDRPRLEGNLSAIGYRNKVPNVRTNESALQHAISDVLNKYGAEYLVEPLKTRKLGFDVSEINRGEQSNSYRNILMASVSEHGTVLLQETGQTVFDLWQLQSLIQHEYEVHKERCTGISVGQALVAILEELSGLRLREAGGVYWIPNEGIETWEKVEQAVRASAIDPSRVKFDLMRTVADERGLLTIKGSLEDEVVRESGRLLNEIVSGDLGERALDNRLSAAKALLGKVERYESILDETLSNLRAACKQCEEAAIMANMQQLASA